MRVPGFIGSLGAGFGSQDSSAMQFSSSSSHLHLTKTQRKILAAGRILARFIGSPAFATISTLQEREFFETFKMSG